MITTPRWMSVLGVLVAYAFLEGFVDPHQVRSIIFAFFGALTAGGMVGYVLGRIADR